MESKTIKKTVAIVLILVAGILAGGCATLTLEKTDGNYKITLETGATVELAEEQTDAVLIGDDGEEDIVEIPTVETVDGGEITDEENGQGAWHDTSTWQNYKNSVGLKNCIQNAYGGQCFALANDFWTNYTGRALSSCGTGAAKGTTNCWEYNAGNDFVMIWDKTQILAGDWVVFSGGTWGHIGMAVGNYNNGYVALFGQNQGGERCSLGGGATNIINKSTNDFIGAFRPKTYIVPEPTADTPSEGNTEATEGIIHYSYVAGDYFSKVLVDLGLDEGRLWGKDGTVAYYTKQLLEQGVLDARGNVKIGIDFTLQKR